MIIDNKVDVANGAEPRAWKISKINRINSNGVVLVTLAQDKYNQHTDYVEYETPDDPSSIVGMWADYYSSDGTAPTDDTPKDNVHSVITYVGKAIIYVGGSFKKFTVNFYDGENPIGLELGQWRFTLDGADASSLVTTDTTGLDNNQIKVKFNGSEDYMGKTLVVSYVSNRGIESSVDITIGGF